MSVGDDDARQGQAFSQLPLEQLAVLDALRAPLWHLIQSTLSEPLPETNPPRDAQSVTNLRTEAATASKRLAEAATGFAQQRERQRRVHDETLAAARDDIEREVAAARASIIEVTQAQQRTAAVGASALGVAPRPVRWDLTYPDASAPHQQSLIATMSPIPAEAGAALTAATASPDNLIAVAGAEGERDVAYWRSQAAQLQARCDDAQDELLSLEARLRALTHLRNYPDRAGGVVGLLRQAEQDAVDRAAEFVRRTARLESLCALAVDPAAVAADELNDPHAPSAGALALGLEEARGLRRISAAVQRRIDSVRAATELYEAVRAPALRDRLRRAEMRRSSLGQMVSGSPATLNAAAAAALKEAESLAPEDTALGVALETQEFLARCRTANADAEAARLQRDEMALQALLLERDAAAAHGRDLRLKAVRAMHATPQGSETRLTLLRALSGGGAVAADVARVKSECSSLRERRPVGH